MKKTQKVLIIILASLSGLVALLTTKIWTITSQKEVKNCEELGFKNLDETSGSATCLTRHYLFGDYQSITLTKNPGPGSLNFSFQKRDQVTSLTGQVVKPPSDALMIKDENGKDLWRSSDIGSGYSSLSRELIPIQDMKKYFLQLATNVSYELTIEPHQVSVLNSCFFSMMTAVIGALLVALMAIRVTPFRMSYPILATSLGLIVLWFGMPFGSTGGWFDGGDDTSYFHWAYSLGYLLDPDLTHSSFIPSWALNHNHHSWGTGLILAPFLMLARFVELNARPGVLQYSLMNFGVIVCGCLGVVMMFNFFRKFASWRASVFMSLFCLLCTSMLKWMFMRNFFSHVPEFLMMSLVSYFAIQYYFYQENGALIYIGMLASSFMAVQVRRENVLIFGVFMAYDWLLLRDQSVRRKVIKISRTFAVAVVSVLVLIGTNYFTQLKSLFGYNSVQQDFLLNDIVGTFLKQAPEVFYGENYGLFYWKNAYSWLAVFACIINLKSWRHWLPLAGLVFAYLMMCTFFNYPNGMEWQNRFLLKLIPVLFGGALLFLTQAPKAFQFIGWGWLMLSVSETIHQYLVQKPARMSFYIDDFSDNMLSYPQSWPGVKMWIFYLPLILVWLLSFVLWINAAMVTKSNRQLKQ